MEYKNSFPVIEVEGNNYEIGLGIGTKGKKQVLHCIQSYKDMFEAFVGLKWEDAKKLAQQYKPIIAAYEPDYLEEMRGIAEGAGVDFDDILLLNCRSEVVLRNAADTKPDGCTAIAVTPERTGGLSTLIGQNWDWKSTQRGAAIIIKMKQSHPDRPNMLMLTEAGIIGKYGFNSAGLGFCFNALSVNDFPESGLPLHVALRGAMDSNNLSDAILNATRMQLGCAVNFMFASRDGEAVDVEVSTTDFDVLYPQDSIVVHTNHFRSLRLPGDGLKETSKAKWPDTFIRGGRAEKKIRAVKGDITIQDFIEVFKDHANFPTSICHHEDPRDPEHNRLCTVWTFVIDLYRMEMHACLGLPCESRFHIYTF